MEKAVLGMFSILSVCIALLLIAVSSFSTAPEPHHVDLTFTYSTLEANVIQGDKVSLNCTVFNNDYNYSINAGLTTSLMSFNNSDPLWTDSDQSRIFNITFDPWVLEDFQPRETRISTLTIKFAEDAPIGSYYFALQGFNNSLNVTVKPRG